MVEKYQKRFRTDNLNTAFYKQIFRYNIKTIHQRSNSPDTDAVKQTDYPKETFAFQHPSPFPLFYNVRIWHRRYHCVCFYGITGN